MREDIEMELSNHITNFSEAINSYTEYTIAQGLSSVDAVSMLELDVSGRIPYTTFETTRTEIYKVMNRDSFARFRAEQAKIWLNMQQSGTSLAQAQPVDETHVEDNIAVESQQLSFSTTI